MDDPDDVELKRRLTADEGDTLFKILFAAIRIGEPASKRRIADVADISSQLVDYHIDKLVSNGQLLFDGRCYRPQKASTDRGNFRTLKKALLQERFINRIVNTMDFSQVEVGESRAIEESILTLLRLFTVNLKGKRR